mmetsp:Transcript_17411/g.48051  ORF Transcript_17411/g.48051 Transcript_17411/m.48051 type:complete len:122 (+) Transcript_17411:1106-1471(+)
MERFYDYLLQFTDKDFFERALLPNLAAGSTNLQNSTEHFLSYSVLGIKVNLRSACSDFLAINLVKDAALIFRTSKLSNPIIKSPRFISPCIGEDFFKEYTTQPFLVVSTTIPRAPGGANTS